MSDYYCTNPAKKCDHRDKETGICKAERHLNRENCEHAKKFVLNYEEETYMRYLCLIKKQNEEILTLLHSIQHKKEK